VSERVTPKPSDLLRSLASHAAASASRTLLICPTRGEGRELLRALARLTGRWIGLVPTTPLPLALEVAGPLLAAEGKTILDEFDEQALLDELLDGSLAGGGRAPHLEALSEGVGFRRAVREAVRALRLAEVPAEQVRRVSFEDPARRDLIARMLARYERRLADERLADGASVLLRAATELERGSPLPGERFLLCPGLGMRGAVGRFLQALETRGAECLDADPVRGVVAPLGYLWSEAETGGTALSGLFAMPHEARTEEPVEIHLFRAAGVTEELREVLRRALAAGWRWDEVEIVTTDPTIYGPALHTLASRLDVPVTFAVGLPVDRTRPGRVVAAWLRWVQQGFPEPVLRALLETGDLAPPRPFRDVEGPRLARRLRRLRIGWGQGRYLPAVETTLARVRADGVRMGREESEQDAQRRHDRELRELEALRALLRPIMGALPVLPEPSDPKPAQVSPAQLAAGLDRFLDAVSPGGEVDGTAVERLGRILDRIQATLTRPTSFAAATAILQEHLSIRVPAPRAEGRAPWGSAGGHLHLSDVEHGGLTGRPATFVVGLDAGRFPGGGTQDPLLLDVERDALAPGDLPRSGDRVDERRFKLAALLSRLRGQVTMSWSSWEAVEGRVLSPSPVLLQAWRLLSRDPNATFRDLAAHVGEACSRIPRGTVHLDEEDAWLGALAKEGRLLAGEDVVLAAHPGLTAGLAARLARSGEPSAHHGIVEVRPKHDPRLDPSRVFSARMFETVASCPLRYLYQYLLRAAPPDDPAYDPERWLDALRRGSLLHLLYQRLLDEAKEQGVAADDPRLEGRALAHLEDLARDARREMPPPSEAVYQREIAELRLEALSFVGMLAADHTEWLATELRFGFDDSEHPAVELGLPGGGAVRVRGAIDRVDRLPSGGLRIVDYKTGLPIDYRSGGTFRGGRRLQHAIYSLVAETLLGERVERMEYHFPTRRGENERIRFLRANLSRAPELLGRLLEIAASGRFVPSPDETDCRFCDYKRVCRVRVERGSVESPMASWAAEHAHGSVYELLRGVRDFEGGL
jgi:RecB family exonuclease